MGNKEVGGNSGEQAGAGASKFDTLSDMPPFNPDAAKAAQAEAVPDDHLNGWGAVIEHSDVTINDPDQANRLAAMRGKPGFREVLAQETERAAAEREANARFEAEYAQALKEEESENKRAENLAAAEANQDVLRTMSIDALRNSKMPGARQEIERRAAEMPADDRGDLAMATVRALEAVKAKKEAEEAASVEASMTEGAAASAETTKVEEVAASAETAETEDTREMWERALDDPDYMTALANKSTKAIQEILGTKQHPRDALEKLLLRAYGAVGEGDVNTQKRDREKLAKIGANYEAYLNALDDGAEALADAEEAAASIETAEAEDTREMWQRALDDPDYMTALANKSSKAIQGILGTKQHPRDALEKLLLRAYGAIGEGDANTQKRDREKLAKIGANYEAYLNSLNNSAEALAEVVAAENPTMESVEAPSEELAPASVAESNESMKDLRSELMGKLGEHADLLDDDEGTIRNLQSLDEAGLQALLDKVNAKIAAQGAEAPRGDFFTPTGTIFEGMPVPGANLPETPSMESVTEPIEATFIPEAPIESVEETVESNTEAIAESNTETITETVDPALVAEAERVAPGLWEALKTAFKERDPSLLKEMFNRSRIGRAINEWRANRRADAADARIARAMANGENPIAGHVESAAEQAIRNNVMKELLGENGMPGMISQNVEFFGGRAVPTAEELQKKSINDLMNLQRDLAAYNRNAGDYRSGTGTNVSDLTGAGEASA